jgi:hypothetical protein
VVSVTGWKRAPLETDSDVVAVATARSSGSTAALIAQVSLLLLLAGCAVEDVVVLETQRPGDASVRDTSFDGMPSFDAGTPLDAETFRDAMPGPGDAAPFPDAECELAGDVFELPADGARTGPLVEDTSGGFAVLREVEMTPAFYPYLNLFPPADFGLNGDAIGRLFALIATDGDLFAATLDQSEYRVAFHRWIVAGGPTTTYEVDSARAIDAATLTPTGAYFTSYDRNALQHVLHLRELDGAFQSDRPLAEVRTSTGASPKLISDGDNVWLAWIDSIGVMIEQIDGSGTPISGPFPLFDCPVISYDVSVFRGTLAVVADCFQQTVVGTWTPAESRWDVIHRGNAAVPSRIDVTLQKTGIVFWVLGEQRPRFRVVDPFLMILGEFSLGVYGGGPVIGMDLAWRDDDRWGFAATHQNPNASYFVELDPNCR